MTDTTEEGKGRRTIQGYLASVGSAAGYGFGTYFAYLVIRDGVPPMTATFFSLLFGLLLMAFLFPRPVPVDLKLASLRGWVVVSMSGLASALGVTSFYLSLDRVSVVIASPRGGSQPARGHLDDTYLLAEAGKGLDQDGRRRRPGCRRRGPRDHRHGLAQHIRNGPTCLQAKRHSKPSRSPKASTRQSSSVWDESRTSWSLVSSDRSGASTAPTSIPSPSSECSPTPARACWSPPDRRTRARSTSATASPSS